MWVHTAERAWMWWFSSLYTATFVSPRRITAPVPGAISETLVTFPGVAQSYSAVGDSDFRVGS